MRTITSIIAALTLAATSFAQETPAAPADAPKTGTKELRQEIGRVFLHNVGVYSVAVVLPDSTVANLAPRDLAVFMGCKLTIKEHNIIGVGGEFRSVSYRVVADAPAGQPMFATIADPEAKVINLVIHIHGAEDINGAGWSRTEQVGKQRRTVTGQTSVVE